MVKKYPPAQLYTLIVGLTPTGRATVETLKLNREGLVNLRRALKEFPADPALQQVHIARKILAKEAAEKGLDFFDYIRSLSQHQMNV